MSYCRNYLSKRDRDRLALVLRNLDLSTRESVPRQIVRAETTYHGTVDLLLDKLWELGYNIVVQDYCEEVVEEDNNVVGNS